MINKTKKTSYDAIYVMNLDRSKDRWGKIQEELDSVGVNYQRFSAIDGYKINIIDLRDNKSFTEIELKAKVTHKVDANTKYIITCDPENDVPTRFGYVGVPISAGELGIWCSNVMIWKDIAQNNYKNTIIFEDDIQIRVDNFAQKLDAFVSHLPSTFDLAFLHLGSIVPWSLLKDVFIPYNEYINKCDSSFHGVGASAIIYSNKAVKTLLSFETYSNPIDVFFWDIALNEDYQNPVFPLLTQGLLEIYMSPQTLVEPVYESIINEMGRM